MALALIIRAVLRERYLRSDIPCGSLACSTCTELYEEGAPPTLAETTGIEVDDPRPSTSSARPVLSVEGRAAAGAAIGRHYVVPDTNVVLHQMDLLESEAFGADIVVLQTVLEEVRNRSLPLYNRLNALVAESGRRVWSFANEACLCVDLTRSPD